jgi:hypothetical protein
MHTNLRATLVAGLTFPLIACGGRDGTGDRERATPTPLTFTTVNYRTLPESLTLEDQKLVQAFWVCDRASETSPLDTTTMRHCSMVFELVLKRLFRGDFEAFVEWWRKHKDMEESKPGRKPS